MSKQEKAGKAAVQKEQRELSRRMGQRVRTLRLNRNLTQADLARQTWTKPPDICRLEAGEQSNPTLRTLVKLAQALGVSVSHLVSATTI